jgi:hypothetical protein
MSAPSACASLPPHRRSPVRICDHRNHFRASCLALIERIWRRLDGYPFDIPGADASVIWGSDRAYRLVLERSARSSTGLLAFATTALAGSLARRAPGPLGAAATWTGDSLPEDRDADWAAPWRARVLGRYQRVPAVLVIGYERAGGNADAPRAASALVELEPLNERALRSVMVAKRTRRADRARAAPVPHVSRGHSREFENEPEPETRSLHVRVLAREAVRSAVAWATDWLIRMMPGWN